MRVSLLLSACLLAACARGESAEERQLDELRKNMDQVTADQDRQVPLETMPKPGDDGYGMARRAASPPPPPPRTVHFMAESGPLQPSDTGDGDADDPGQLPALRMTGAAAAKRPAGLLRPATDPDPQAVPSDGAPAPRVSAVDPEAKRDYDAAVALVQSRQYGPARDAFASFMVKWPDHPYVENATYWRGECFFAEGDLAKAKEQFEGLIARFPGGPKTPDALLKLGLLSQKAGDKATARLYFDRILRDYPRSESARRVPREEKK